MKEGKNNTVMLTIIGIATLLVAVVGATFAFFSAQISGDVSKTPVTVTSANLVIGFTGGNVIAANDIYPSAKEWGTKTFSVSSKSTLGTASSYKINMVVEANDECTNANPYCDVTQGQTNGRIKKFQSGALSYTITSTSNAAVSAQTGVTTEMFAKDVHFTAEETSITSLNENAKIELGSGTILGQGENIETTHSYTIKMFFKENSQDQNANQGAQFKAHLEAEDGHID